MTSTVRRRRQQCLEKEIEKETKGKDKDDERV